MSQATSTVSPRDAVAPPIVRKRRRSGLLRPLLMLGGIVVVAAGSLGYWLNTGRWVSTDDAYVEADKLAVSTDVSGIVAAIPVHEGERVKQGQVLFRLDPQQFQIAVDGAKANRAQTALDMESMKRDYQRMLADIGMREAQVQSDQADYQRYAALVKGGGVTKQEYDNARFKLAADQQQLDAAKQQAEVQLAKLGGDPNVDVKTTPQYLAAQAKLAEAERELDHTVVKAPFDGIVTEVPKLQPGMYLSASTGAFGLVSTDHVWVEAQPKETQLTWVKPGDHVNVTVDSYPGHTWDGVVESIAPASSNEFSVLPAQNSSGNWVKVVQRLPLRVRVDRRPDDPELRAGMSVEIDVDTGHVRTLADLF
jgi:membrane fusion protein (multidrug efflux system)